MGREQKKAALPSIGNHAKTRHSKAARLAQADPLIYSSINAYKEPPKVTHKVYLEIAENPDKKEKKLETEVTTDRQPPPGFEFIAAGNAVLSTKCKELSREQEALVFIVSESKGLDLYDQLKRLGYHFRQRIVDQAREELQAEGSEEPYRFLIPGRPEAIPQDKQELARQADAVLRDLFPRIPNTDRVEIILQSFNKDNQSFNGRLKVGFGKLPLAQRVQLAALAHIRHTKTRYDELLKEGVRWENARKAVERPCLNVIFKWRGDEETGRDQLDEILREVIEISDSEDESEEESSREETPIARPGWQSEASFLSRSYPTVHEPAHFLGRVAATPSAATPGVATPSVTTPNLQREESVLLLSPEPPRRPSRKERKAAKQANQRFKRYYQIAESFRHEPREPDMARSYEPDHRLPTNSSEQMQVPRFQEFSRVPNANPAPTSAPSQPGLYHPATMRSRAPEVASREHVYRDDISYADVPRSWAPEVASREHVYRDDISYADVPRSRAPEVASREHVYRDDISYADVPRSRMTDTVGREQMYHGDASYASAPRYHASSSRERIRGQSPVLVRVLDGNEPRVGPPSDRQGYVQPPLVPARHQLQDMLVQSIEPRSPGGASRPREHVSYLPTTSRPHYEPPRVISRTIVHQPLGYTQPAAPTYVSEAESIRYMPRPMTTQPESLDPFSGAGFVQIHRVPERRPEPYYPPEVPLPRTRIIEHPVSYPGSRARSPVVYYVDSPRPDRGADPSRTRVHSVISNNHSGNLPAEASYRTRANPIYVDEPARIRNHTVWEAPRPVERIIERRDYR